MQPQVLLTYGDDQTGYPHPDHLKVHDISVLAFERAGDPDWYPEAGAPFQPSKLYYSAWSRARMLAVHETLLRETGSRRSTRSGSTGPTRTIASPPASTSPASSGPALMPCAPTPPRSTRRRAGGSASTTTRWRAVYRWDDFILARSLVGDVPADDSERDLFAGVREAADTRR